MTIEDAKTEIRRTVSIYLRKDEYGTYRIPVEKQRPVFMIGAPGIGKTAVMEQIAMEMDLALVAYSMTHHTRQSAIGLPYIVHKTYGDTEADVSLYTMSEIVSSVYESMERSGKKEGILFLDEVNCVSETLAPSMLQFLQYKTFGNHRIPSGWVIVTAGNPPEYNRSVREFDVVTLDRLKVLEITPDYSVWKRYAREKQIHKAVQTYLEVREADFYSIEASSEGKTYVTARGWEDLAEAITLYEEMGYPVDLRLVGQYIRNRRIAAEFATYYELYNKYRGDYKIREILDGKSLPEIEERAKNAGFDERLTVTELLMEAVLQDVSASAEEEARVRELVPKLRDMKARARNREETIYLMKEAGEGALRAISVKEAGSGISASEKRRRLYAAAFAEEAQRRIRLSEGSDNDAFDLVRQLAGEYVDSMKSHVSDTERHLKNLFAFIERCFGDSNEMLVAVTDLAGSTGLAAFLSEHAPDEYFRYQKRYMLYERNRELKDMVDKIGN